ncbi:MAG: hypothetical protein B7Y80_20085 [Hyphomicrobium sp. 32-62-53]|nr:MAG: hypothetical protein B7Z29_19915 [Hyphomicrobium sp. 12-62-95]OYX97333.1 MAG: hypothetical protein B7Y80_20085 [Hyphomicrobium sp. 32-62-53]
MRIKFDKVGTGLEAMVTGTSALAGPALQTALARALNHTGGVAFTSVKKALARQMGLTQKALQEDGRSLTKLQAIPGRLSFAVVARGRATNMMLHKARPTRRGITAYPWGVKHSFGSAFMIPSRSSIFRRKTQARFPLEKLLGPNITKELVKDAPPEAFEATVAQRLPKRVAHEVATIAKGILT